MNKNEIDSIARAVAQRLAGTPATTNASVRHEPTDLSWRMPVVNVPSDVSATRMGEPGFSSGSARIADYVDHTLLKAETTRDQIEKLCREAVEHSFATVCVNGSWVELCSELVRGSSVGVAAVVGFPLGAMSTEAKAAETRNLVHKGADEIDMVIALGHVLEGEWDYVENDIRGVVEAADGKLVKVILETGALEPLQIVRASALAMEAGAHYVKTSTGFHPSGGATPEAVALMRLAVGDKLGVKASGGVRDCASALRVIAAGATRIGTSSGVQLTECIGAGPRELGDLLGDPEKHDLVCRSGSCPNPY